MDDDRQRIERLHRAQVDILRMITAETPLSVVLDAVVDRIEELIPESIGSVLEVRDGRVYDAAGHNLPRAYRDAIDGLEIGPNHGSCGTAAHFGEVVWVEEIESDPRWQEYVEIALPHGLRSCWSVPVKDSKTSDVIATFAVYASEPRAPEITDTRLLEDMAEVVRIAIETSRAEQTRRVLADENRAVSEQLGRLLDSTSEGIYGLDSDGRCTFVNPAALSMLGDMDASDVLGKEMHEVIGHVRSDGTSYPAGRCPIIEAIRLDQACTLDGDLVRRADGSMFPVISTSAPLRDRETGAAVGAVVTFNDITNRVEYERGLEHLLRSKDEFIASVAHELRTPLAAVVGFSEVLHDGWDGMTDDEAYELLAHVRRESVEVANIVEDLLVAARADLGRIRVESKPVDLAGETTAALESWRQGELSHVAVTGSAPLVSGDPARVRQIVRNLLTNAVKYGGSDIVVAVGERDGFGYVEVSDDGPGVAEERIEEIFEPYVRAHTREGTTASLGLGLAIARRLAQAMGGDLIHERSDGRTRFRLSLSLR
ncbi:MAG: ATP-binding protein [Acidimicrobiia bacterium]